MISISAEHIEFVFGDETILRDVSFQLNDGEKMGIVGINGAGKSTLFRILTGTVSATAGSFYISKGKSIGLLEQAGGVTGENRVYDEMLLAFQPLVRMEERMAQLEQQINAGASAAHDAAYESLIASYTSLSERFRDEGGLTYVSRTGALLKHMGFDETTWQLRISSLSGGQKTRLALVRLLLQEPDILLLDEPTNHLDTETLEWLETYLKGYAKTLIVISHDRYFLDNVTTGILEIEHGNGTFYSGNYSAYVKQKETDRLIAEKHYQNQQKEIHRIEAYIEQQRRWNRERNIIAAESRQKMLDKMERVARPADAPAQIRFAFSKGLESGFDVLTLEGITKAFGDHTLFSDLSVAVKKRDRLFICGPNGCGKSTLLKVITGKLLPDRGECLSGAHVRTGYYDQEQQALHDDNTVIEELWQDYENLTATQIRSTLALFQFHAEDMEKKVAVLSGGEKARLTLSKLVLSDDNLLILDEPTNHLDIPSREALEQALLAFGGTLIAVSHDRYFIRKLATRILDLGSIPPLDFHDGYDAYLTWRQTIPDAGEAIKHTAAPTPSAHSVQKEQYLQNKQAAAQRRRDERSLSKTKEDIGATEVRIEEIDHQITGDAATDYVRLSALTEEKESLEAKLLALYENEEALTDALRQQESPSAADL